MDDLIEKTLALNEAEDTYRNEVDLSVNFTEEAEVPEDYDKYIEVPDNVEIEFDINVEHRSWGIKDIDVFLRGTVEFEVIVRSDLPDEEGKEVVIPVKIDFTDVDVKINWLSGGGYAPAALNVLLGGEEGREVKEVEVDFYYATKE